MLVHIMFVMNAHFLTLTITFALIPMTSEALIGARPFAVQKLDHAVLITKVPNISL